MRDARQLLLSKEKAILKLKTLCKGASLDSLRNKILKDLFSCCFSSLVHCCVCLDKACDVVNKYKNVLDEISTF